MKKSILSLIAGAIVALASCNQSDEMPGQPQDGEQLTTFTIHTPPAARSEVSDLSRYIVEAYEGNDATGELAARAEAATGTLTLGLKKNTEYTFLFWADKGTAKTTSQPSNGYWNTDDLKSVTVTSGKESTASEVAYCLVTTFNSKEFDAHQAVTLRNATAQVNFVEAAGLSATNNKLVVTYAAGELNVGTGKVTDVQGAITHTFTILGEISANKLFATDYILAPKGEQRMLDLTIKLNTEESKTLTNVPFEQCFITNIKGEYSSLGEFTFTIKADDTWDGNNDVPLAQAKVGDFYYDDETYSTEYDNTKNCIGIVYKVNNDGRSGKIVGLTQNQGDGKKWSTENGETGATNTTDGRENMATIAALIANSNGSKSWDTYPAFKWVAAQNGKEEGGWDATNDKWYLPAKDEFSALYTAYDTYGKDNFNTKLTTAGGTEFKDYHYLSSTEYSSTDS